MNKKVYLGDAVYANHDEFGLVLTTEDGYKATNRIVLEHSILWALEAYINKMKEGGDSSDSNET